MHTHYLPLFKIQATWSFLTIISTTHLLYYRILLNWNTKDAIHSTKNYRMNFWKSSLMKGVAFSEVFRKQDNLAKYTEIFRNFLLEIYDPFDLWLKISRIFRRMVHFLEIQPFNICLLLQFWNCWHFSLNGKHPWPALLLYRCHGEKFDHWHLGG